MFPKPRSVENRPDSDWESCTQGITQSVVVFCIVFFFLPVVLAVEGDQRSREYLGATCAEFASSQPGAAKDGISHESQAHKGKWVKWTGRIAKIDETLWGLEVGVKCRPNSPGVDATLSMESVPKSSLSSLIEMREIRFKGRVDDVDELSGVRIGSAELGWGDTAKSTEVEKPGGTLRADEESGQGVFVPQGGNIPGNPNVRSWREPYTGMEFVWVPGGCFKMGCGPWATECYEDEHPVHEVCVSGFWIAAHEVSQGQWARVMGVNPSGFQKTDTLPVEMVSWQDAQQFISRLNDLGKGKVKFRLPTETEWEYACRSGGRNEKYSGANEADAVAWYDQNSGGVTHPVVSKAPNGLGIFNMSGNVREWCEDIYSKDAYRRHKPNNPINIRGGSEPVVRGGGWYYGSKVTRCTNRYSYPVDKRRSDLGLRLVRDH